MGAEMITTEYLYEIETALRRPDVQEALMGFKKIMIQRDDLSFRFTIKIGEEAEG